jgi:hypothetical protein
MRKGLCPNSCRFRKFYASPLRHGALRFTLSHMQHGRHIATVKLTVLHSVSQNVIIIGQQLLGLRNPNPLCKQLFESINAITDSYHEIELCSVAPCRHSIDLPCSNDPSTTNVGCVLSIRIFRFRTGEARFEVLWLQ